MSSLAWLGGGGAAGPCRANGAKSSAQQQQQQQCTYFNLFRNYVSVFGTPAESTCKWRRYLQAIRQTVSHNAKSTNTLKHILTARRSCRTLPCTSVHREGRWFNRRVGTTSCCGQPRIARESEKKSISYTQYRARTHTNTWKKSLGCVGSTAFVERNRAAISP